MSEDKNESDALKKFKEALEKDDLYDKKVESFKEKKLLVDDYKYTNELEKIRQNESDIKKVNNVNVSIMSDEEIEKTMNLNRAYLEGAKNGMMFLNETFRKFIPCWAGNLILIAGRTGDGKSSATANLIYSTIRQKNPLTGQNRRVLTISSEETPVQVYNRLTCLAKGWNFNDQDEFTDEQKQTLIEYCAIWPKNGVMVIGENGFGITTSLEGIKSIFENLIKTETHYDMILVDYIQKITESKKNSKMQQFTVMKEVMNLFDYYKNIYPAVIIVMSQLSSQKLGDPENEIDFQDRLRGSRDIITPCTVALEMVKDIQNLRTRWYVRKNRYRGSVVGMHKDTAFDRGMFMPMTPEWEKFVADKRDQQANERIMSVIESKKQETKE